MDDSWFNPFSEENGAISSLNSFGLANKNSTQGSSLLPLLAQDDFERPMIENMDSSGHLHQSDTDIIESCCGECFNVDENEEIVKDSQEQESLIQSVAILSAINKENNVPIECFINEGLNVYEECDNMQNEIPIRYYKGSFALSRNPKGSCKRKSRLCFPSVSRSFQMKRLHDESMDTEKDITMAERLQLLFKSEFSPVNASNKTVGCKLEFASGCVPMAERFQELLSCDACFFESEAKDPSLGLARKMTANFFGDPRDEEHKKVLPLDEDIAGSGTNNQDIENISCRMSSYSVVNPVAQSPNGRFQGTLLEAPDDEENSCIQEKPNEPIIPSHYVVGPIAQSMNELFQEALLKAPDTEESSYIQAKSKGPIFGFASHLQRVLQHEKNERILFMKTVQMGQKSCDDEQCLDVRVIGKNSHGRLVSCSCNVVRPPKDWIEHANISRIENDMSFVTVIFNTRTNQDLELEVGRIVRIYPPWY